MPPTFWSPTGSALPESCPGSGFYCPGAAADSVFHGGRPLVVPVGGATTSVTTEAVQHDLTLGITCASFDSAAVTQTLAARYGVDPSLVSFFNLCAARRRTLQEAKRRRELQTAGLRLAITIASSGTAADGTPVTAPPIDELLSAVEAADDATLGTALGAALGTTVTVTSVAPEQVGL